MVGSTIKCDSRGEIKVSDLLAFINKLVLNSGQGWTKAEADARFVNVTGDSMTGHLYMKGAAKINLNNNTWLEGKSSRLYQNGHMVLDNTNGLLKSEPGDVNLNSRGKRYLIVNGSGVYLNYNTGKKTYMEGSHLAWHAGNSKGIRTRLVGNTLYMTDNQTNA